MDGVDSNNATHRLANGNVTTSQSVSITEQLSALSMDCDPESSARDWKTAKDPRKIARKYQTDLCKKALEENVIVCLGTGSGKTHIAVLLIYEMGHLIKKPQKNICVFLAPTVALVQQQAKVIQDSIDFKVGTYCGSSKHLKSHHDWEKELEKYEVLVMTPQILLRNLSHCFIRMELIGLLIFDECHYAQSDSNHPYAEIMKVFYKNEVKTLPRIFGMTASPKLGKGASINNLESVLHATVCSVEDKDELEQFVATPKVQVYYYGPVVNSILSCHMTYYKKLEEIKHQCVSMLSRKNDDHGSLQRIKKSLNRQHGKLIFCLENLGVWGALQASRILLKGDLSERSELIESEGSGGDDSLCDRYLIQSASLFSCDCNEDGTEADLSCVEILKEPLFSTKLLRLIGILSKFGLQPNMKCIVFVDRIVIARVIAYILHNLKFLSSWKCEFLVGVHSGLKSMSHSRRTMNVILEKFRSGELNLLVATKVGEEGLDIQTCCLVIRFDLPQTVASFIQSRGRARMPQSEYVFLADRGNEKELRLIESFKKDEDQMNMEIECRLSKLTYVDFEERTYKVDSTGATITSGSSISLLHHYCSKLPHDDPKPQFFYFDDVEGTVCHIILPSNAPVHQIVSSPQPSIETAKRDACLQACKELHALGALTDYLLPDQDDESEELEQDSSDSDSCDDEASRMELHEMLVPAALKEPWTDLENTVNLNFYFIKFIPHPEDRIYKEFGLFLKGHLPKEAERMNLNLHLARGRFVVTGLVPSGFVKFDKDEIRQAEEFQQMCLKVILDREEFVDEFVSLGKNDRSNSSSLTFYLLLPLFLDENRKAMAIDWKLVRRCLSSPIFKAPEVYRNGIVLHPAGQLQLANGPKSIGDVVNSLVYSPCKEAFFFISEVITEKNAYSVCKDSTTHIEHYSSVYNFHLAYPDQPLLRAKQLFRLDNLLRKKGHLDAREKDEHFIEIPPEICQLKIIGFSKDVGSSWSLLPSIMHRLESLLVAIELKQMLSAAFPEGHQVTIDRILEALTTERCHEHFSLERLEVLGDAFLKFSVARHLFLLYDSLDEGQLTRKRSNLVNNSNLFKLATARNIQVYIRDRSFNPCQFFALGRPCPIICNNDVEIIIHSPPESGQKNQANAELRCNRSHHWLYKKTIADVVEALIGAFIVDSGFKAATAFLKWIGIRVDFEASQVKDICSASPTFMRLSAQIDLNALEKELGYPFLHKGLLIQAFVHPSYNHHLGGCYQRLEFLGDAVMDYLITSYLYSVYPKLKPGQLTDLRSVSVNNNSFADIAVCRSFHKYIICDSSSLCESMNKYVDSITKPSREKCLVEGPMCPKVLGDLVESSVGAILLDTGCDLKIVWKIMLSFLDPVMSFSKLQLNPIRELQELCQSHNWDLQFPTSRKDGKFLVEAEVTGEDLRVTACATNINRKAARRMASEQVFVNLKAQGYKQKSKSLEEVLKSSGKMEAKLIGYDETPAHASTPNSLGFNNMKLIEPTRSKGNPKVHPARMKLIEPTRSNGNPKVHPAREEPSKSCVSSVKSNGTPSKASIWQPVKNIGNHSGNAEPHTTGGLQKGSAKSRLFEICAANCWKPPLFECCEEAGPSHLKEFSYKVVLEIEEASSTVLECFGEPRAKKKDAAEHAAEGALWYLSCERVLS